MRRKDERGWRTRKEVDEANPPPGEEKAGTPQEATKSVQPQSGTTHEKTQKEKIENYIEEKIKLIGNKKPNQRRRKEAVQINRRLTKPQPKEVQR